MKLLIYMKMQFKKLFSNFQVSILYFIALPLIIGAVMGFMQEALHSNDLKIDVISIKVIDEDKSELSQEFIKFLKKPEMKDVLKVVDDDSDAEVTIPKGYAEDTLAFKDSTITIQDKNTSEFKLGTVKSIIDNYHKGLYTALKGEENKSYLQQVKLESKQQENPYSFFSVSLISLACGMMILSLTNTDVEKNEKVFNNRVNSTPNTKTALLNYKFITYFFYVFISIAIYWLVYRISGVAFQGNVGGLIVISATSSILIVSIIIFLITILTEKYAKAGAMVLFMLPIIGGGVFLDKVNFLGKIVPTYYISELFKGYERTGIIDWKIVMVLFLVSFGLYIISIFKIMNRRGRHENSMVNLG